MKEFLAIPPVFKAEQWDGTDESAAVIFNAIKNHTGFVEGQVNTQLRDGGVFKRLELIRLRGYIKDGQERESVLEGDWVVFHPEGRFEVLPDRAFQKLYTPKEEGE